MKVHFRAFHGPADWGWVQEQVPVLRVEDTAGIMAVDEDTNTTIAACIMDNFTNNSVQAHFMLTFNMVFRHGFMQEVYDYVFTHLGKKYMYGLVPSSNEKAVRINEHMGFTEKVRMPDAFADGVDYIVMELKKENCKYLSQVRAA
jgi:hypothetical protein